MTCDYTRRPSLVAAKQVIALAAELGGVIEYASAESAVEE